MIGGLFRGLARPGSHAAINNHGQPRYIGCSITAQPQCGLRRFVWPADATCREMRDGRCATGRCGTDEISPKGEMRDGDAGRCGTDE